MGLRLLAAQQKAFLRIVRCTSSATQAKQTPETVTATVVPKKILKEEIEQCYSKLDLTFTNTKEAFKSKTNHELLRGYIVLRLCAIESLVKHSQKILAVIRAILGKRLFKRVLKSTFYGQFVAGEDPKEIEPVVERLKRFGVKSILDYSVEADISTEDATKAAEKSKSAAEVSPAAFQSRVHPKTIKDTHERYSAHDEFADRRKGVVGASWRTTTDNGRYKDIELSSDSRTYFYEGEEVCDRNRDIFMGTVDAVADATRGEGFAAIKVTALGRPALLLKLSECIEQAHNFFKTLTGADKIQFSRLGELELSKKLQEFGVKADSEEVREWFKSVDFDNDGYVDFHGWDKILDNNEKLGNMFQVLDLKTGQMEPLIQNLSEDEEKEFANMVRRLITISEHSISKGVRLMVDAEQTYFQPAISRLCIELMRRYNKEKGYIFNTYQAYLRDTKDAIERDLQLARREGWHFGLKLVRGAYMEQERQRASVIGYPDPVNPNYEATSKMYHDCLTRLADEHDKRGRGTVSVMIASHNEETVRFAVNLMRERGIAPSEKIMCFAQLLGMCDHMSFSLGQAGYSVYKYVPYGPVEEVLPYLTRRATENGSILKKATHERDLLRSEFWRRMRHGQLIHRVPAS
ncbi:unnamed protein product [Cylicocyclus nassatus]|uniref:Proline dehydrogenase n=1 Tax=Cylicocyclus nassatus TaxID=53992 RepID=A0AA36H033_CYLNA|nr:unnamed protein product [Cylicocyclus nassatus]